VKLSNLRITPHLCILVYVTLLSSASFLASYPIRREMIYARVDILNLPAPFGQF
jgi:hypothetical protein